MTDHQPEPGALDVQLAPLWAMTALLPTPALEQLTRALHGRLFAPETAQKRRVAELGFLSTLLDEWLQPPEKLPYVERRLYDACRPGDAPESPSSSQLVARYRSWRRACYAAWTCRDDGSWVEGGLPWPAGIPGRTYRTPYTSDECKASVKACADAIGKLPSSHEYRVWRLNRVARARSRGETHRIASLGRILQVLAPERTGTDGWQIVLRLVFD